MSASRGRSAAGSALASFVVTALVVCGVWWWLGAPIQIASPTASVGKPYCLSYAPFRDSQNPLVEGTRVDAAQIEQDLALLSKYTDCIRTYSVDDGRADVLESARRHGLKVLHGIWVSSDPAKTRRQIETTVALAKAYPDVIAAVVVGNEVLLRGEMSSTDLIGYIRQVKAQVPMPVTYADVWEFWLRYPDVQSAVDFVTIHVLPYWEDFPIPATRAAAHVAAIRARVAAAFPGKEIVIGEFGWPSAGRMREDARPSPSNQARAIIEAMELAKRENFRMNVIEAFDQPWKRELEGAVGGYWGIIDRATGAPKFSFDGTVSDHPHWVVQALAGVLLVALTFGAAFFAGREKGLSASQWLRIAALALVLGVLFGWVIEAVVINSFSPGSWLRSLAFAAIAAAAPIVCAAAYAAGRSTPSFASLLGSRGRRVSLEWLLGGTLIALMLVTVEATLGLVFDPRYRDIPFAPLTAAAVPFLVLLASMPRPAGQRAVAETAAAAALAVSAVYIVFNETFANWQSVWFCGALIGLAIILALARDAPSSG
ncbi:MAG: beta-(1-6) glucans synthase [Xanthobacteraceae bacterium]